MDEYNAAAESGQENETSKLAKVLGCSEQEVEQLCEVFQKSPTELPNMLSGLNWSAEKVAKFAGSLSSDFIAVKFEFHQPERDGVCGASCIIFDSKTGKIVDDLYWITYTTLPPAFSVNLGWEAFRDGINKIGGRYDKSLFERFRSIIRSVVTREILHNLARQDTPELRAQIVSDILTASANLSPQKPDCSLEVEHFSAARLELGGIRSRREEPGGENAEPSEEGLSVPCKAIIDPVNGKATRTLQEGDLIEVELIDGPGMAGVVYRLLQKVGAKPIFRVVSTEVLDTGMMIVRFWISDDIVGTIRVSPEIRLKTPQSAETAISRIDFTALREKLMIAVVGVIVVGLVVFIVSMLIE